MPTDRQHGGAILQPISLVAPANRGLNKQQETSILGPEWCTEALNCVFDEAGRLSSRNGWVNQTSAAATGTPQFEQLHEYIRENDTSTLIAAGGSKLWQGLSTWTDLTGTATVTVGNNWKFVNFNDVVLGFQQGEQPIVYTGTGAFADVVASAGTCPQGNSVLSAFGRVWGSGSDYQTIKYSDLLSYTAWSGGSAGSIDMSSVWPSGMDAIVALAAYNGQLVIFGRNTIVLYGDGAGSALGINPANLYVTDTIIGVGCIARDSVKQIDSGDILFLSNSGVQSLGRLIQEKSNPINNVSRNNRDYVMESVSTETLSKVRSEFSPEESFYLLSLPTPGKVFCFDTSGKMEDGSMRTTEWDNMVPLSLVRTKLGTLYIALSSEGGKIGTYSGYVDPAGAYQFNYASGWLNLGEEAALYLKMAKTLSSTLFISSNSTVAFKWDFDFENSFSSKTKSFTAGSGSEYGIGEYGIAEYSGGISLRTASVPMDGTGQYIRVGIQADIEGSVLALQQLNLYAKIGRLAKAE